MLRPRWYKIISDLWDNKIRSLLVVSSIAVGLFAIGMIASMHVLLGEDMRAGYRATNPANITFNLSNFDESLLETIRNSEQVKQAEGALVVTLRANNGDEWVAIDVKAFSDIEEKQINHLALVEGKWPPDDREIVVDVYKLNDLNANLGDMVEFKLPSGTKRELKLVGLVHDQSIGSSGQAGGFFLSPVQSYTTLETAKWLEQPTGMNQLYVTVQENTLDEKYLRQVANLLIDDIEDAGETVYNATVRSSENHPNRVYVEAITVILFLLGFMVVFLSAFLITNTLSALLNQQAHQIGVMKTIGARRGQIMSIYMALIFTFGMIAFLIAMPLSSQAAYNLLVFLGGQINMDMQGYRPVGLAVIIQLVIALVVPQIAAFVPILHGTRVSAVEALSGFTQEKPPEHRGLLDRQLRRTRRISRPMLISLRNTFRRKGRLALTMLTLTLGGAIFIATFNVQGSLNNHIMNIGKYFRADANISMNRYYRIEEIEEIVTRNPQVAHIEGWAAALGEIVMPDGSVGEAVSILAPPASSKLVEPIMLEGRWLRPGDQNAITVNERFWEIFPGLKAGDTLRLKVFGDEHDLQVVGIFQLSGKSGGYIAYNNYENLSEIIHQSNKANSYRVIARQPDLTLKEQKALGKQIEDQLEENGFTVSDASAGLTITETTSQGLTVLTSFLLIMASMIAVVGGISMSGTLSMNVLERTREMGIMRSIGASDRAIFSLVMVEGLLIGIFSWFFGTLAAFPISTLMANAFNLALFGSLAEFTFTPTGIIVWFIVVLLLSILASVMPARNAVRLTIREVLSYE
jgi:putative ABC transport system permease protein